VLRGHVDLPVRPQHAHFLQGALEHFPVHAAQGTPVLQGSQHQAAGRLAVSRQQGLQVAAGQGAHGGQTPFQGSSRWRAAEAGVGPAQKVIQGNVEEIGYALQSLFAREAGALFIIGDRGLGYAQTSRQVPLPQLFRGAKLSQARGEISHGQKLTQFE
jgi:hypothetical protein